MAKKNISFLDYLSVLVRWRKFIIVNFFVVCFIVAGISLVIPKWYKSSATILPPTRDSGFNFGALMNNLPIGALGMGFGAVSEEASMVIAIMNSRTVMESVVREFGLVERYKSENLEEAVRTLRGNVSIELTEENTIKLAATAKTPYFAFRKEDDRVRDLVRDMTEYIIHQIDNTNKRLQTEQAKNTRVFIEKRYFQNVEDLKKAEEELSAFQKTYGTIALEEQTKATIDAMAQMKAQLAMKEVELNIQEKYLGKDHADYIKIKNEYNELKNKFQDLMRGETGTNLDVSVLVPLNQVPTIGLEYVRLYREVKLQESIMEFLLPQYEQAKIQEAKDTSTIQVLDKPSRPIKRFKPKRSIMVLAAGFISVLFCFAAAYVSLNLAYLKQTDETRHQQLNQMLNNLKPKNFFK